MKTCSEKSTDDVVVATLKKRYFDLLPKENFPGTPEITREADHLERAILELTAAKTIHNPS